MPYALTIDVVPPGGGKIAVSHTFYGKTEQEARAHFAAHLAECDWLSAADEEGRIEEELESIGEDEWPEYEESFEPTDAGRSELASDDGPDDDEDDEDEDDDG